LCAAVGRPDLAADDRYATNEARVRNRDSLVAELEAVLAASPTEEWVRLLLDSGVPGGKIRGVGEALRAAASGGRGRDEPGSASQGRFRRARRPGVLVLSRAAPLAAGTPLLGQHTAEVLGELGVDDERLSELERRGVIARARTA